MLSTKAVAYINVDIAVGGNHTLRIGGSPLLESVTIESMKKVNDPHVKANGEKMTVYERILETRTSKSIPPYGKLAAWSDYAAFLQFVGIPSLDLSYDYKVFYPVYHTVHDTYKWLQGLMDPYFVYHLTTTRVMSWLLMNIADNFVLPFDVSKYGHALNQSLKTLKQNYDADLKQHNIKLSSIDMAITNFTNEAQKFEKKKERAMARKSDIQLRNLNDRMVNVEKAFIYRLGLPNQPYTRHLVYAPSFNNRYGTTSFPGISDLLFIPNKTKADWENIKQQISIVFKSICEARDTLLEDE